MRIALITNDFLPKKGGITNVMVNVSKNLTELGETVFVFNKTYHKEDKLYFEVLSNDKTIKGILTHNVKFFYFLIYLIFKILFSFKGITFKDKLKLITFYCFYYKLLVRRIISIKNLVECFNTYKIDIIISGTASIPLFYCYILSKWFNIPMVTIAHGDDFLVRYPLKIKTFILENIQNIIVTNKIMKRLLLKIHKVDSNKVNVIHLGVDVKSSRVEESISDLRKKFGIDPMDFIVLTVSRFYPRKGFGTVLKTIKLIIDENPNIPIKYLIIGDGEDRYNIEHLISQLKIEDYVTLLGDVDDNIKNQYYKLSDLFILVPEIKKHSIEGFGIVYIEANYFKLPTLGSRSGGVKIAIDDGKSGFLITPKDEVALKEKILFLSENEQLRRKLGEYGHQRVIKFFNWQKNVLEYQNILAKCVNDYYNSRKKNLISR